MAKKDHVEKIVRPVGGMNSDANPAALPDGQARWMKNADSVPSPNEAPVDEGGNGFTLPPLDGNFTAFPDALLPRRRRYLVNASWTTTLILHAVVKDWRETVYNVPVPDAASLDAFMTGLGLVVLASGAQYGTAGFVPEQWQKVVYVNPLTGAYFTVDFAEAAAEAAPWGNNTCVGFLEDVNLNQFYWHNHNDLGRHHVLMYDGDAQTFGRVIETPLLNYSLDFRLGPNVHQVMYPGLPADTRLHYWTEKSNPPRKFNTDRCLAQSYLQTPMRYRTPDEFFCAGKFIPEKQPKPGAPFQDPTHATNFIGHQSFQARYRFVFDDGEKSRFGPISTLLFVPPSADTQSASTMPNCIPLTNVSAGPATVRKIEIAVREGNTGDWALYDTVERNDALDAANGYDYLTHTFTYNFYNDRTGIVLPKEETEPNYDPHPIRAGSQTLLPDNTIAYGDILEGYDNMDPAALAAVSVSGATLDLTEPSMRTVVVFLVVHNMYFDVNQPVHKGAPFGADAVFGGIGGAMGAQFDAGTGTQYGQKLIGGGFTLYIPGTGYVATTRQVVFDAGISDSIFGGNVVDLLPSDTQSERNDLLNTMSDGDSYFVQRCEFTVPAGVYPVRVMGHGVQPIGNYQNTSTLLMGTTNANFYNNTGSNVINAEQEIIVDCTTDNVLIGRTNGPIPPGWTFDNRYFVVADLTEPTGADHFTVFGYLSNVGATAPVELAVLQPSGGSGTLVAVAQTDHNGRFFFSRRDNDPGDFALAVEYNAAQVVAFTAAVPTPAGALHTFNPTVNAATLPFYNQWSQAFINGQVFNPTTNAPVGNATVVYGRSRAVLTDANGNFALLVHNDASLLKRNDYFIVAHNEFHTFDWALYDPSGLPTQGYPLQTGLVGNAPVRLEILGMGASVNPTNHEYNMGAPMFVDGQAQTGPDRIAQSPVSANPLAVGVSALGNEHLKLGGMYPIGLVLHDEQGRHAALQRLPHWFFGVQPILNGSLLLTQLTVAFNGCVFPDWVKRVSIARTKNTRIERSYGAGFLQWFVKNMDYVNSAGQSTTALAATMVKFEVAGLDLFNAANYEMTTTAFVPSQDDIVRFYNVGNAFALSVLDLEIRSSDGLTCVVDKDPALTNFTPAFWVEIFTRPAVTDNLPYYEISEMFDTTGVPGNNQCAVGTVVLNTFDTYYVERKIPNGSGGTYNKITMEHHARMDTVIGTGGEDIGRPFFFNANARQAWKESLVRVTNALLREGTLNGLSTLDESSKFMFPIAQGAITVLHPEGDMLYVLQKDGLQYVLINKNRLRLGDGGSLTAESSKLFSEPVPIRGGYGCQTAPAFAHKAGTLFFPDEKRGCVVSVTGDKALPISQAGKTRFFFKQLKHAYDANQGNAARYFLHGAIDHAMDRYVLTKFSPDEGFVDLSKRMRTQSPFTMLYDYDRKAWTTSAGYTPEYFGGLQGQRAGNAFVCFRHGVPWFHHAGNAVPNNFFGVDTGQVVQLAIASPNDEMNFHSVGLESRTAQTPFGPSPYEATEVYTSSGHRSVIPAAAFEYRNGAWYAPVFGDTSNGEPFYNGPNLKGAWALFTFVRTPAAAGLYNELGKFVFFVSPSAKTP